MALNKSGLDRVDSRRDVITQKMFQEIKDQKHSLHYLLPTVKVSNGFTAHIPTPITTEQNFSLWTRFHPILYIKKVLDCFRLDLLLLLLVLLVLLLCVCVC